MESHVDVVKSLLEAGADSNYSYKGKPTLSWIQNFINKNKTEKSNKWIHIEKQQIYLYMPFESS